MESTEQPRSKHKGNPNWVKGMKALPGVGRPKNAIDIKDILTTVRKVTGANFEVLLAQHLADAKEAYENGTDKRSYTTMIMSIMEKVTRSLPKDIKIDVTGKVEHIAVLQAQDEAINAKLAQMSFVLADVEQEPVPALLSPPDTELHDQPGPGAEIMQLVPIVEQDLVPARHLDADAAPKKKRTMKAGLGSIAPAPVSAQIGVPALVPGEA
jgi:hypothetical protein